MVNTKISKKYDFERTWKESETISRVKRRIFSQTKRRVDEKERTRRSSYKGLTEDALAYGAEEGRGKLRKAAERSKHPATRRYPNEGTQRIEICVIV